MRDLWVNDYRGSPVGDGEDPKRPQKRHKVSNNPFTLSSGGLGKSPASSPASPASPADVADVDEFDRWHPSCGTDVQDEPYITDPVEYWYQR